MENVYDNIAKEKRAQMLKEQAEREEMIRKAQSSPTQFYYDTTQNVDFGIPTDETARMFNTNDPRPDLRDSDSQIDFGIPTDETARMFNTNNPRPDLRDSDSQIDFGIPTQDLADIEELSINEWKNERNDKFENQRKVLIDTTPTQYGEKVETKFVDFNHLVSGDASWAMSKLNSLLHMPDTLEYTQYVAGYLDKLKDKPEYYNRILSTILHDFASIKKKIIRGEHLEKYERQQLFNSIKIFAIIVEKGYPVDYDLFSEIEIPYKVNYGEYFFTERVPYDIVIQQMIETIEHKSDIIGNEVTNPINVVSSTNGEDKMKATELGKLALKAHYTNHKLSDDTMNFPNETIGLINSIQEFQAAREIQMQQDKIVREQQLAQLTQEMAETREGRSLR